MQILSHSYDVEELTVLTSGTRYKQYKTHSTGWALDSINISKFNNPVFIAETRDGREWCIRLGEATFARIVTTDKLEVVRVLDMLEDELTNMQGRICRAIPDIKFTCCLYEGEKMYV